MDNRAKFVLRGGNLNLFVTENGAVVSIRKDGAQSAVGIEVVGAERGAEVAGEGEREGRSNYLSGSDPAAWVTSVPHFEKVRIRGIRKGVDLLCYADGAQFEYDLVLHAGSRAEDLLLRFTGAEKMSLTEKGDLRIQTAAGDLLQHKPRVWQQAGTRREPITAGYRLRDDGTVSISVGTYDRARDLVIDPVISYATYLGGQLDDSASAIAVDSSGSAYVTGSTYSLDFPTTVGAYQRSATRGPHAFVAKFNPAGTALVYSTYLLGSGSDIGWSIAVDSAGNAYIAGTTASNDFPVTNGAYRTVFRRNFGPRCLCDETQPHRNGVSVFNLPWTMFRVQPYYYTDRCRRKRVRRG